MDSRSSKSHAHEALTGALSAEYEVSWEAMYSAGVSVRGVNSSRCGKLRARVFQMCWIAELAAVSSVMRWVPVCAQRPQKAHEMTQTGGNKTKTRGAGLIQRLSDTTSIIVQQTAVHL